MVIRTRLRSIVIPLVLYAVSASVTSYFVWHALHGERGLKAKDAYRAQINDLSQQLASLQIERRGWQHRVDMMRSESIDKDLLEEEARTVLDRVHKNELVIFVPPTQGQPTASAH